MKPAVNIRNEPGSPYADWIVDGLKSIETREKPTLNRLIGRRVKVIRTGAGKAQVIGEITITGSKQYLTKSQFEADKDKHMVSDTSSYAIRTTKVGYTLSDPERYDHEYDAPTPRGIVYSKAIA